MLRKKCLTSRSHIVKGSNLNDSTNALEPNIVFDVDVKSTTNDLAEADGLDGLSIESLFKDIIK